MISLSPFLFLEGFRMVASELICSGNSFSKQARSEFALIDGNF